MNILLICSFINACFKIFSSLIMYIGTPAMTALIESGQFEQYMQPFVGISDDNDINMLMENAKIMVSINPVYHIITFALFIASLIGVIKMLKLNKTGVYIYSISQLCVILASSLFVYNTLPASPFWSDILTTIMFIVIYHLGFKQIEMRKNEQ